MLTWNTNMTDLLTGAATGAVVNYFFTGKGEGSRKMQDGAILGAAVVLFMPTIKGLTKDLGLGKKAA